MSDRETLKHFRLTISDGEATPTYRAPCLLQSKGLNRSSSYRDDDVPGCPPADPFGRTTGSTWTVRTEKSKSGGISGDGVLSSDDHEFWEEWFGKRNEARGVRIHMESQQTPAVVRGHYEGMFFLSQLDVTQEDDDGLVMVKIDLQSTGEIKWFNTPVTTP